MPSFLFSVALSALLMQTPSLMTFSDLTGNWQGEYSCGKAHLNLDIQNISNGRVEAVFNFGYYASTTSRKLHPDWQGAFTLHGTFQNNELDLKSGKWITYPRQRSWVPLDVRVTYDAARNQFVGSLPNTHGAIDSDACLKVTLKR